MSTSLSPREDALAEAVLERLRSASETRAVDLLPVVYDQLRALARHHLAPIGPGQTMQATALVHEAWLRLVENGDPGWEGRAHFFGAASRAMRLILVENARRKSAVKRGGDRRREALADVAEFDGNATPEHILAMDELLEKLAKLDPLKARIVTLRFFGGLTMPEVAEVVGCGLTKAEKEWRFARSWLQAEIIRRSDND